MSGHSTGLHPVTARALMLVLRVVLIMASATVAASVVTRIAWEIMPSRDYDIFVFDQTVPTDDYPEHAVLEELFEYHKVPYDPAVDYFGAKPGGGGAHGTWPSEPPEIVILADAYGVYAPTGTAEGQPVLEPQTRYLSLPQALDIAAWAESGVPTYGEFAMVYAPTPGDAGAVIEQTFGFTSSPWVFRYWDNLDGVSPAITSIYEGTWDYTGPGIVLVAGPAAGRPGHPRIVVLTSDDLTNPLPQISGGAPGAIRGVASFDNWGSIVAAGPDTELDANFEFLVNELGRAKLDEHGLDPIFPALIRRDNTLYFTGNGLANETPFRLNHLRGAATFTRLVTGKEFRFLYTILEPSVGWLIDTAERRR